MRKPMLPMITILAACSSSSESPPVSVPPPPPQPCDHTVRWQNPMFDVDENPLGPTDLKHATIYVGRIPNAPDNELEYIVVMDAYNLAWTLREQPPGTYWVRLTVSNEAGESDKSNQTSFTC